MTFCPTFRVSGFRERGKRGRRQEGPAERQQGVRYGPDENKMCVFNKVKTNTLSFHTQGGKKRENKSHLAGGGFLWSMIALISSESEIIV